MKPRELWWLYEFCNLLRSLVKQSHNKDIMLLTPPPDSITRSKAHIRLTAGASLKDSCTSRPFLHRRTKNLAGTLPLPSSTTNCIETMPTNPTEYGRCQKRWSWVGSR